MANEKIIPIDHNLVTWGLGQNYTFNGCLAYIMECLGENKNYFDYWFFSGITWDNLIQVYCTDYSRYAPCVSSVSDSQKFIKRIFDIIGYEYEYITQEELNANKTHYLEKLVSTIDKGIPVLIHSDTLTDPDNYNVISGYDENGRKILIMKGETKVINKTIDSENEIPHDWIFIGKKYKETDFKTVYQSTINDLANQLQRKPENNIVFGVEAFEKWAEDIENIILPNKLGSQLDIFKHHNLYVCNVATNGSDIVYLMRAYELNKKNEYIMDICKLYRNMGDLWANKNDKHNLEALGGGFDISIETLNDKEKCKAIADIIREFSMNMKKVIDIINGI